MSRAARCGRLRRNNYLWSTARVGYHQDWCRTHGEGTIVEPESIADEERHNEFTLVSCLFLDKLVDLCQNNISHGINGRVQSRRALSIRVCQHPSWRRRVRYIEQVADGEIADKEIRCELRFSLQTERNGQFRDVVAN